MTSKRICITTSCQKGNVRPNNEDAISIDGKLIRDDSYNTIIEIGNSDRDIHLCAVADGMGGYEGGEVASIDNSVRDGNDSLVLESMVLGICIKAMHDALIGRKEGPYTKQFSNCRYVSGCHAKLEENANHQWTITDMNSSNGTMVNGIPLQPGKPANIKNGDKVTLANITLTVKLS